MQNYAAISLENVNGISKAKVVGQIYLNQRHPIYAGSYYRLKYNYPSYYDIDNVLIMDTAQIMKNNFYRNETIITDFYAQTMPGNGQNKVEIEIILDIPKYQKIYYIPTLLETMKFAWVQYFSIFLVVLYVGRYTLRFVYTYRVFTTTVRNDLP